MLFAIIDYIKYKNRMGMYSERSLQSQGGRLAVVASFPLLHEYDPRYIFILHTRDSFMSWLVMYYTCSPWSHVGSFSERGFILDATTSGVIEHPFADYLDGKSYIVIRMLKDADKSDAMNLIKVGRSAIGLKFNWLGIIKFFFRIVLGKHAHYEFRFSADFLILALMLSPFAYFSHYFGILLLFVSALYILIVLINTPKRRKMRRIMQASYECR